MSRYVEITFSAIVTMRRKVYISDEDYKSLVSPFSYQRTFTKLENEFVGPRSNYVKDSLRIRDLE